jgi:hypothetical protein
MQSRIDGVVIVPLRKIPDERGMVMHMLRADAPHFEKFGEVYFATAYPGVIKAWHLHSRQTQNYVCVSGMIKLVLFDDREALSMGGNASAPRPLCSPTVRPRFTIQPKWAGSIRSPTRSRTAGTSSTADRAAVRSVCIMFTPEQLSILGRLIRPCGAEQLAAHVRSCGFSEAEYLRRHDDLQAAGLDETASLFQFLTRGFKEARSVPAGAFMQGIERLLALPMDNQDYLLNLTGAAIVAQLEADPAADVWKNHREVIGTLAGAGRFHPFFVIGDSHSRLYGHEVVVGDIVMIPLNLLCTGGSAIGLGRSDSKSNYGERLLNWARQARLDDDEDSPAIFVKFGQVDVEFVWTFRRIRQGTTVFSMDDFDGFATESVASYGKFLDDLMRLVPARRLRICSIFPPTLSEAAWSEGYVNAHIGFLEGDRDVAALSEAVRGLEIPSQPIRTELHRNYNSRLQAMCRERGLAFVDDFNPLLDGGVTIAPRFVEGHAGDTHHIHRGGRADAVLASLIVRFAEVRAVA